MSYFDRNRPCQKQYTMNDCVPAIVENIIKAQDESIDDECSTSCNYAIQQLRGIINENNPPHTTIPFILYCSGTCKPFIGSGIFKNVDEDTNKYTFFGCVETPIFRAKRFVKGRNYCVELELLVPATDNCEIKPYCNNGESSVCSFFSKKNPITDFLATGICLTVDLENFMGITCLDPINPL